VLEVQIEALFEIHPAKKIAWWIKKSWKYEFQWLARQL